MAGSTARNRGKSKEQLAEMTAKNNEMRKNDPEHALAANRKQALTVSLKNQFFNTKSKTVYQNKHITDEILDLEAHALFDKGVFDPESRWIEDFLYNYLKEAKDKPNSRPAERLASVLFSESALHDISDYIERQNAKDIDYYKYLVRGELYDKQQAVFDYIGERKQLIINSRRSGKTFLMGRLLVKAILESPGAEVAYINRNSSAAIRQIKKPLTDAIKRANLSIIKGSVEAQDLTLSNGSRILIIGNNNAGDVDKMRGESLACVIMDECGHQRNTRQLIREVVEPAMIDYGKESRLYMVGTPPRNKGTFVEDVYNNALSRGWKVWHWTFLDNPFIPDRDEVIEEACKNNGVSKDSAFIRREYYGEMNAFDTDALWIKKYSSNPSEKLPSNGLIGYVGVDWGYEDKAAVVSVIASKQLGRGWIVDSWSEHCEGISAISNEIVRQVESLREKYDIDNPMIICDTNEKGAVWDLYSTYHLRNVHLAYKYDKDYAEDQLNELFVTNKLMIVNDPSNSVTEDIEKSMWKRDEETDKILHELDDDIWHPNALMAVLYISRQFAFDVLAWIDHNKAARDIITERNTKVGVESVVPNELKGGWDCD